jgi:hypothetical protein
MPSSNTKWPVQKVWAGLLAGALTTILVFVVRQVVPGIEIPADVAAAITTILSFIVSYMTPPGANEAVVLT